MNYFCTLFDYNYLTRGMVLYDSLVAHCLSFKIWILCMDQKTHQILSKMKLRHAVLIKLSDFENKDLANAKKNRTSQEYCWTCASSLLWYLFQKNPNLKLLSYLDADLAFYSDPSPIFAQMGQNSVLIVPHRFPPEKADIALQNGTYNVSLISFRNDRTGKECLRWWKDQCLAWCYYRVEDNRLGDQKYLDEFPKKFKNIKSLSHLGAGLAHWNIDQYRVWQEGKIIYVDGQPLIFFHFQGIKIFAPFFLSGKSFPGPYSIKSPYWLMLYKPYIDKIYKKTVVCRQFDPHFLSGFVPVSKKKFYFYLAFKILQLTLIQRLEAKLVKLFWIAFNKSSKLRLQTGNWLKIILDQTDSLISFFDQKLLYVRAVKTYLLQNECTRLDDCVLLWKLKTHQPPASDRHIEYPWTARQLAKLKNGKILDVGASSTPMWVKLFPEKFDFYGVDINKPASSNGIKFFQNDIRETQFSSNFFDAVICVSTLEHIGVPGRYHSDDDPDGDKKALKEMARISKKGGYLFLTVPFGHADVLPINKLYTNSRLLPLLSDWKIVNEEYVKFDSRYGYWFPVLAAVAETTDMILDSWYSIALIVARKK